jgi:hypothetical protein
MLIYCIWEQNIQKGNNTEAKTEEFINKRVLNITQVRDEFLGFIMQSEETLNGKWCGRCSSMLPLSMYEVVDKEIKDVLGPETVKLKITIEWDEMDLVSS